MRIIQDDWPTMARAEKFDGEFEFQASRRAYLRVRQHQDGRTIIYGTFASQWQGESGSAAGVLLTPPADATKGDWVLWPGMLSAIRTVAEDLGYGSDQLIRQCLADMPAEEI